MNSSDKQHLLPHKVCPDTLHTVYFPASLETSAPISGSWMQPPAIGICIGWKILKKQSKSQRHNCISETLYNATGVISWSMRGLSEPGFSVSGVTSCFLGNGFVMFQWFLGLDLVLQFNSDFLLPAPWMVSKAMLCDAMTTSVSNGLQCYDHICISKFVPRFSKLSYWSYQRPPELTVQVTSLRSEEKIRDVLRKAAILDNRGDLPSLTLLW